MKDVAASIPGMTMPGAKEFNSADRNLVYDWIDKVDEVVETANRLKREGRAEEYQAFVEENVDLLKYKTAANNIQNQLAKLRKQVSIVRESNMPTAEKDQRIKELKEIEKRYIKNLDIKTKRSETL